MDACELVVLLSGKSSKRCYAYLMCAVDLVVEHHDYLYAGTTKVLYPEVAKHFDVTPTAVDRGVAWAVSDCWDYGNRVLLEKVAGRPLIEKPSPKDFIFLVSGYLRKNPPRLA